MKEEISLFIQCLKPEAKVELLKMLVDSFDKVTVTALYGASEEITSEEIWQENPGENILLIDTRITTG